MTANTKGWTIIKLLTVLVLLCVMLQLLGGCQSNNAASRGIGTITAGGIKGGSLLGTVICDLAGPNNYPQAVAALLPEYTVITENSSKLNDVRRGAIVEAFDPHAVSGLRTGAVAYWYPQYLATVVFAIDRDLTDSLIENWSDLALARENIGVASPLNAGGRADNPLFVCAAAYGLEGEGFSLKSATKLYAGLEDENRLITNSFDEPVTICFDYQAAALKKDGRNLEIIVPRDGTLTFSKGLISNTELEFTGDADAVLIEVGFRLLDGRCDAALYPDEKDYSAATPVTDYDHMSNALFELTRVIRRDIFNLRLFSSADGREHQYWVFIYFIIIVLWLASLINRIAHRNMRKTVLAAGVLIIGWMMTRLIRYQLIGTDIYLWFTYYLFELSLAVAFMWIAHIVDKPEGKIRAPLWFKAFAAYMYIIVATVYTNSLHGLVFVFDYTRQNWQNEYGHNVVYYILQVSWSLSVAASIVILLIKSRGSFRNRGAVFPLLFFLLLIAYQYGYVNRIPIARESDKTMVIGVLMLLLAESLIRAGIIPVNTKYKALFNRSPMGMRITDNVGNTALSSASAIEIDQSLLGRALEYHPKPIRYDENTLLFAAPIIGGNVLWQDDISKLNRLRYEIEESVAKLKTANDILAEEEKIKRAAHEEREKTQLMAQLEAEITGHTIKLNAMVEQLENAADSRMAMRRIALLLCYLKRRCSLFFREREENFISADDIKATMDELAEMGDYAGVSTILTSGLKTRVSIRHATLMYDFLYMIVYWATWLKNARMIISLNEENERSILRLTTTEDARSFKPDKGLEKAIFTAVGVYAVRELDDGATGISLSFPIGGESDG